MKNSKRIVSIVLSLVMMMSLFSISLSVSAESAPGNIALARRTASEGMILLENDNNVLPIANNATVSVFGLNQINYTRGGTGSGDVRVDYFVNLLQGMKNKVADGKISLYQPLVSAYESYTASTSTANQRENAVYTSSLLNDAAAASSVAVVTIGRTTGEGNDNNAAKGSYYLSDQETYLLDDVTSRFSNVVVLLNVGSVIDTSWIATYKARGLDSVLITWLPGMEGGNAMADVLVGDAYPSGKTVDTYAKSYDDYPSSTTFKESTTFVNYIEDVYVGYRYFETIPDAAQKVNYEFGYGKSYTTFNISDVNVTNDGTNIHVSAKVTNTGTRPGKEVVQVYFGAPQGLLGKPSKELGNYAKTKELAAGESQTVNISYAINDMSSFDDLGKVAKSAYVLEKGIYNIYVGNSVRNVALGGTYTVAQNTVTEQLTQELQPTLLDRRMLSDGTFETLPTIPNANIFTVAASGESVLDAENFTSADSGVTNTTWGEVGFGDNGVYVTGSTMTAGKGVDFKVKVAETATYDVKFRVSNTGTPINNAIKLFINGVNQNLNISVPTTTGDTNFADTVTVPVELKNGNTTIRVESNGRFPNLDYISITRQATSNEYNKGSSYTGGKKIMLIDVYNNPSLMDQFVAQFSIEDLIVMSAGRRATIGDGSGSWANGGTGGIGFQAEYGVPNMQTADGPAGIRTAKTCTQFPCSTLLAATWNQELVEEVGKAVGTEAVLNLADIWLAPGMNLHRDPLCGRNFEYYSEDPVVTGKTAAAITRGVQSKNVAVAVKHYAVNNKEQNRSNSDSRLSERALRELYLKGFEISIKEGKAWTVMSSYNLINGVEAAESYALCTTILRDEWGFDGLVMTDWFNNSVHYKELKAGNDVKMSSGNPANLRTALNNGTLTRAEMERNIKNVVSVSMRVEVFQKRLKDPKYGVLNTAIAKADATMKTDRFAKAEVVFPELVKDFYAVYNEARAILTNPLRLETSSEVPNNFGTFLDVGAVINTATANLDAAVADLNINLISANAGDTVTLPITLKDCDNLAGMKGTLSYDSSLLTLEGISAKSGFAVTSAGNTFVAFTNSGKGVNGDVVVGYAVFTAKKDLNGDVTTPVTVGSLTATNAALAETTVAVIPTAVTILGIPPMRGDVNLDGKVNLADVVLLMQYLSGNIELSANQKKAADVSNDGAVNVGDSIIIMQMCL